MVIGRLPPLPIGHLLITLAPSPISLLNTLDSRLLTDLISPLKQCMYTRRYISIEKNIEDIIPIPKYIVRTTPDDHTRILLSKAYDKVIEITSHLGRIDKTCHGH